MTEKNRKFLNQLSMISAGVGAFLILGVAGNSDFRDELQYADAETRAYHESRMASPETSTSLGILGATALVVGAIGMYKTQENNKQR
ncbi:MAG: hypothetical protein Q4C08_04075 [Pseudomonadota bacterium]|nr:hypothetical protein [Pseudomonadota bacterium]